MVIKTSIFVYRLFKLHLCSHHHGHMKYQTLLQTLITTSSPTAKGLFPISLTLDFVHHARCILFNMPCFFPLSNQALTS